MPSLHGTWLSRRILARRRDPAWSTSTRGASVHQPVGLPAHHVPDCLAFLPSPLPDYPHRHADWRVRPRIVEQINHATGKEADRSNQSALQAGPSAPCKGLLFQQVRVLSRQRSSRPGSYPSGCGGNEAVGAWEKGGGVRPSASWQAVTYVNTETAPQDTMRRPTLLGPGEGCHGGNVSDDKFPAASPGYWVTACQQGTSGNTGSPCVVVGYRLDQQAPWASGRNGRRRGS